MKKFFKGLWTIYKIISVVGMTLSVGSLWIFGKDPNYWKGCTEGMERAAKFFGCRLNIKLEEDEEEFEDFVEDID